MKKELESKIERRITEKLERAGWYVVKLMQTSKNGIPDRMALRAGRAVFIEVKRKGEEATPLQRIRHRELIALGFECRVADDVEKIKDLL